MGHGNGVIVITVFFFILGLNLTIALIHVIVQ